MPETARAVRKWLNTLVFVIAAGAIIYFAVRNFSAFVHVLIVALGFGAVVMIHEFGHFVVAKLSGIKVEAFSPKNRNRDSLSLSAEAFRRGNKGNRRPGQR